jgi:hypothetical protein
MTNYAIGTVLGPKRTQKSIVMNWNMSRSARTYLVNFLNKELTEIFAGDASDAAVSNVSQLPQRLVHEYSAHRHRILAAVSRSSKKIHDYNFSSFPIFQR